MTTTNDALKARSATMQRQREEFEITVARLYWQQQMGTATIASRLGVNQTSVNSALDRCGIPRRQKVKEWP